MSAAANLSGKLMQMQLAFQQQQELLAHLAHELLERRALALLDAAALLLGVHGRVSLARVAAALDRLEQLARECRARKLRPAAALLLD